MYCLSVHLPVYLYVCPSVYLSVCPSVCPFVHLSVCLSQNRTLNVCLSIAQGVSSLKRAICLSGQLREAVETVEMPKLQVVLIPDGDCIITSKSLMIDQSPLSPSFHLWLC